MTTEIVEYSKTDAALADLASKYKGVIFDVSTKEGMGTAIKARAELRGYRLELEKTRKLIKEPALRRSQMIDSEARRITAAIEALEIPIDDQIKADDRRKKAELEAAEAARKAAEEAKLAAERAEIEKARAAIADQERQSRLKIEEAERAARMKIEEEQRAARQAREAEEERITAERRKAEAERAAAEEATRKLRQAEEDKLRAEREAEEERQREIRRKANELTDAREMLATFKERFGHIEEFAPVVKAIDAVMKRKAA